MDFTRMVTDAGIPGLVKRQLSSKSRILLKSAPKKGHALPILRRDGTGSKIDLYVL